MRKSFLRDFLYFAIYQINSNKIIDAIRKINEYIIYGCFLVIYNVEHGVYTSSELDDVYTNSIWSEI